MMTWGIGGPLKAKLIAAGDRRFWTFAKNDYLSARKRSGGSRLQSFTRALEVDPRDAEVKGKLRLCEGHLERITADGASKQKMLNEAAMKFEEAAELWKKSPDPYLGLERLIRLFRPRQGQQAAERGAGAWARREQAGDVAAGRWIHDAAQQSVKDAQKIKGLDVTERSYLFHARQDYERARTCIRGLEVMGTPQIAYSTRSRLSTSCIRG